MYVCMYVCIYIYIYIHVYVCIHMHMHMHMHTYIHIYIYIYTHTCYYTIDTSLSLSLALSLYIYIHIYIYIYIQNTFSKVTTQTPAPKGVESPKSVLGVSSSGVRSYPRNYLPFRSLFDFLLFLYHSYILGFTYLCLFILRSCPRNCFRFAPLVAPRSPLRLARPASRSVGISI